MQIFDPDTRNLSERHKKIYAYFELAYTVVDVTAASLFVLGSILFFREATAYAGTWLFLIGSILFGLRPTLKLVREYAYLRVGDYEDVAVRRP
ncbi:YrhK family protein [Neptunicoccus cionae]|uniref:YrhK family protein n=1 Tax=Neptunicoccus cionae TaxID=2035344 RepID=UPI000C78EFB9|nr:YrhK family protein [Amylibacter cionae]PLS20302.1 N-acetyl-gamma-glutamyl-phosphate reductase [Amylibacter cionae]